LKWAVINFFFVETEFRTMEELEKVFQPISGKPAYRRNK
jgi:hypothetical protein